MYLTLMPCNLYGPNDNFDLENSHFIPAMIKKIIQNNNTKNEPIEIWGNGKPKREIMHVDDLANAILFIIKKKIKNDKVLLKKIRLSPVINIGCGTENTIAQFAKIICKILKNNNKLTYNLSYLKNNSIKWCSTTIRMLMNLK